MSEKQICTAPDFLLPSILDFASLSKVDFQRRRRKRRRKRRERERGGRQTGREEREGGAGRAFAVFLRTLVYERKD